MVIVQDNGSYVCSYFCSPYNKVLMQDAKQENLQYENMF
jgi:hypothetical protein